MIIKEELENAINLNRTIWEVCDVFKCSDVTIRNYMKKYGIKSPKGFFSTGKKAGRPIGIPCSEEQKNFMSNRMSGKGNPFYGQKHSDDTRNMMSFNHADFTGKNNPFRRSLDDPEKLIEHKKRCQDIWDNRTIEQKEEIAQKLSYSMSNSSCFKDSNFHKCHLSGFMETKKAGRIFYRSSWERDLCKKLDDSDFVLKFDLEPYTIQYRDKNEAIRFTRIDFDIELINGKRVIIEVKPIGLQSYGNNVYKINGIRNYCKLNDFDFMLFTKKEISKFEQIIMEGYDV